MHQIFWRLNRVYPSFRLTHSLTLSHHLWIILSSKVVTLTSLSVALLVLRIALLLTTIALAHLLLDLEHVGLGCCCCCRTDTHRLNKSRHLLWGGRQGVLPIREGLKVRVVAPVVTIWVRLGDLGQMSVILGRMTDSLRQIGDGLLMLMLLLKQRLHLMIISLRMMLRHSTVRVYLIVTKLVVVLPRKLISNSLSSPT